MDYYNEGLVLRPQEINYWQIQSREQDLLQKEFKYRTTGKDPQLSI